MYIVTNVIPLRKVEGLLATYAHRAESIQSELREKSYLLNISSHLHEF